MSAQIDTPDTRTDAAEQTVAPAAAVALVEMTGLRKAAIVLLNMDREAGAEGLEGAEVGDRIVHREVLFPCLKGKGTRCL